MRDVIQRVIAAEAEANAIVEAARNDANRILSDTQRKCLEMSARASRDARAEAERMLAAATNEADGEKQARLSMAVAAIEAEVQIEDAAMARSVDAALRCVCGQR